MALLYETMILSTYNICWVAKQVSSVSELTKLSYEWGNDLENTELKLEEGTEDGFLCHKSENRRIASKIANQNVIFYSHSIKNLTVITLTMKG